MNQVFDFIQEYIWVYVWMILTTWVNIVAPLPASTTVNPVTAYFTDPQRAIGIGALIFVCTALHRVYLFRKEIFDDAKNLNVIKIFLPYSLTGAIAGGLLVVHINAKLLAAIVVGASLYFIYKTLSQKESERNKESHHFNKAAVALSSGFLQGSGMPGSDVRNNYLRTMLSEKSVRGVGSAISIFSFLTSGLIILLHQNLTRGDLLFVVTVVPLLIPAQIYGKKFLEKIPDVHAKRIAIAFSLLGAGLLTYKYLI